MPRDKLWPTIRMLAAEKLVQIAVLKVAPTTHPDFPALCACMMHYGNQMVARRAPELVKSGRISQEYADKMIAKAQASLKEACEIDGEST